MPDETTVVALPATPPPPPPPSPQAQPLLKTLIASTIGGWGYGALAAVLSHPLDTIKTQQQVLASLRGHEQLAGGASVAGRLRVTLAGLYRGIVPAMSASVLFRAVPFTAYEAVTRLLRQQGRGGAPPSAAASGGGDISSAPPPPHHPSASSSSSSSSPPGWDWNNHPVATAAVGGAAGGLARATLEFPFEAAKVRAQALSSRGGGRASLRGLLGLRGFEATAARNVAVIAAFWSLMELSRAPREAVAPAAEYPRANAFLAGGGCSAAAWAMVYPFDVVKSNVQVRQHGGSNGSNGGSASRRANRDARPGGGGGNGATGRGVRWALYRRVLRDGTRQDGSLLRFLYRGLGAGLARSVVANGVAYVAYMDIKAFFEERL